MKITIMDSPAAGTWSRDCELIYLSSYKGFRLCYHRDEDNTYWLLKAEGTISYKVTAEEFSTAGYLINLPDEGAFFEIQISPWIHEFGREHTDILDKCKHYIFQFYDETVEIIAQKITFEKLDEKPSFSSSC